MFPELKKRLKSFVISEKGSISKQSVLAIGAFLTGTSLGLVKEIKQVKAGGGCIACSCSSCSSSCAAGGAGGSCVFSCSAGHTNSLVSSYNKQTGTVTTNHSHAVSCRSSSCAGHDGDSGGASGQGASDGSGRDGGRGDSGGQGASGGRDGGGRGDGGRGGQGGGQGGCFLINTPILMANGLSKPIQEINEGEEVMAWDKYTDRTIPSKVTKKFIHENNTNQYMIINNKLSLTPNHPMFINGAWSRIDNVKLGDYLQDDNGNSVKVTDIQLVKEDNPLNVFNLEVDKYHTYYANNFLAHNKGQGGGQGGGRGK